MSEYQYYEFKAIDKHLSQEDREEIGSWSSRTNPSSTSAAFTYHYSDFPQRALAVVEKYFDAMFYISNWGVVRLIFKFPNHLINMKRLRPYCMNEEIRLHVKTDVTLLDIELNNEDGGNWIEGEGWLDSLVTLREDILAGDLRCLYLFSIKNSIETALYDPDCIDLERIEPPVPANLKALNGALLDFAQLFEINQDILAVAAATSPSREEKSDDGYLNCLTHLSDTEKNEWLTRLLKNEPSLPILLKRRLKEFAGKKKEPVLIKGRTIGQLFRAVQEMKENRRLEEKRKQEEKKLAKLTKTGQQEEVLWTRVDRLISEKKTKSYEEAIEILKDLKELSIHRKQGNDFYSRVELIRKKYSRLSGLQWRIKEAGLVRP
ncbi:hypothetical protein DMA11_05290 [Marinilabiliaceae bacterium JC017]|nr:hypothetical protein DMA11_05290 [Marinilabiliaceae bacterium JC017]